MKKSIINNTEILIPETWSDINLDMYLKLRELETRKIQMDLIDYNIEFICIMIGSAKKDLLEILSIEFDELFEHLFTLTTSISKRPTSDIIKIEDKTYIFDKNKQNITIGMYIDLDIINKDGDFWSVANKIASIFIRPVKKEKKFFIKLKELMGFTILPSDYSIKKYDALESKMYSDEFYFKLPMPYLIEVAGFFLTLGKK
jgi:hypothetical protein